MTDTFDTGLRLSPFDPRWRSGIDWEALQREANAKDQKAARLRERNAGLPYVEQPPNFKPPKVLKPARKSTYKPKSERRPQIDSKTAHIRRLLAERGPLTRAEIAFALDMPSRLVPSLLQHDMDSGRVRKNKDTFPLKFVLIGAAA